MKELRQRTVNDSKSFNFILLTLVLLYFCIGCILFGFFFTSNDSIQAIINSSQFWSKLLSFYISKNTTIPFIVCTSLVVLLSIVFFVFKVLKRFPPTITIIALGLNSVVCVIVQALFYVFDKFDIFFDFQFLYIIPLITIILSGVFLIYDFIDYSSGTYNPVRANSKLPTEHAVEETLDLISKTSKSYFNNHKINNKSFEEKILIEVLEEKESEPDYKTDEGFLNNDALEKAAINFISSVTHNAEENVEKEVVVE